MQMVKIRFTNEDHRERIVDLARNTRVVALRGHYYVIPVEALTMLDTWKCEYEIVERGGFDALVVHSLRSVAAGKA